MSGCLENRETNKKKQVSSAAKSFLCYFAVCIHDQIPNDSHKLCIISHAGEIATAETSVINCIGFHPTKPNLEGGNY